MEKDEVVKLYGELMQDSTLTSDNFLIVSGWNEIHAMENATGMEMDDIAQIITDREDKNNCWGFGDEYGYCTKCYKAIRISPTSYGWLPEYADLFDGTERWCVDCISEDKEIYIDHIMNNPNRSNVLFSDGELEDLGFTRLDVDYESGWHPHQNDNPKEILEELRKEYDEVIFSITDKGQFDVHFTCFVRNQVKEEECLNG